MATESFNSNQLRQIVEIKRGELDDWTAKGYLVPSYLEDAACGKRCMWSRDDVYTVAVFKALVDSGLTAMATHEYLEKTPNEIMEDNSIKIKYEVDSKIEVLFG